ncbi:RNA polymerase sigma factor [Paenibacillus methanolicus]|uniref:RNA polymerase sigma-70 factor (ECF subfamily) n=1 Tax=Paenibacillus methanolicus TaxID=582686 RepID=A0A5S5C9C7_9BACL|nr:RNA polymerase sigma factor [Paenibacillus methanolicus]TYP74583.1 RNA polymerase sigma-70 factor (ECF subfamily) [Paenibacillus methanolicus]
MDEHAAGRTAREFADLYERHIDRVYRLCFILLRNSADADDAVQSVFLKLFKHGQTFRDREHEKAWMIVTAKNTCKDILKSWWRSRRVDLDALPENTYWDRHDERRRDVLERLLRLPEKYRTVLYLYYVEDYSVREISRLLDRKESTLQTQLAKGRARLKADWGGKQGEGQPAQGAIGIAEAKRGS